MNDYKISVIIPHYNIPHLLMRCLKSIPVRKEVQVIVVDDCSPEGTIYKDKYPELSRPYLEFYQTAQGGSAGRARNLGLEHAQGEWVLFVDSDDLLKEGMYELIIQHLESDCDILFFNAESVMSDDLSQKADRDYYTDLFDDYQKDHSELRLRYDFQSLWGKLFKRSFIEKNHIRCDETMYSNDVKFSFMAGHLAGKIKVVNDPLYIVTQRSGSLASSQFNNKKISLQECKTRLEVMLNIVKYSQENNIPFKGHLHLDLSRALRQNYPIQYGFLLIKLLVKWPGMFLEFLRRDFRTIRGLMGKK